MIREVLKEIKPDRKQEKQVRDITKEVLSKIKIRDAKAILGGSGAKGTWLRNAYDIDIYVKFNYKKYIDKDISKILGKTLKKKSSELKNSMEAGIIIRSRSKVLLLR